MRVQHKYNRFIKYMANQTIDRKILMTDIKRLFYIKKNFLLQGLVYTTNNDIFILKYAPDRKIIMLIAYLAAK